MKLSSFAKSMLENSYIHNGESIEERFETISFLYASDSEHQKRLLRYLSDQWVIPSSPILFNSTKDLREKMTIDGSFQWRKYEMLGIIRNQPISCFGQYIPDNLPGIIDSASESKYLSTSGGGYSKYYGDVRTITKKSPGVIKLMCEDDKTVMAFYQGDSRRGAEAAYLNVSHPEVESFINGRDPSGGDFNQKFLNLHHGLVIDDDFLRKVSNNENVTLVHPHNNEAFGSVSARKLWFDSLTQRHKTGEPYLMNKDTCNRYLPQTQKDLGLEVKSSNLCTEIILAANEERTFVCNIMNVNLALNDEFKDDPLFIQDVIHAMDNVAELFINTANPETMSKAIYSAYRERALSMGVLGFHSYLQKNMIPWESPMAKGINIRIFKDLHEKAIAASLYLGSLYGECPDMEGTGRRNSHLIGIAPTASTSQILGESPSIEPMRSNGYTQRTQSGTNVIKNRYLKDHLASIGKDIDEVWDSIFAHEGSVQQLEFLDDWIKEVFKTAFEIDQHYVVQHALDRSIWVCQGQSVNLFFPSIVSVEYLHSVHWKAMTQGLKTLYYLRSKPLSSGESVTTVEVKASKNFVTDPTECLFCQ